MLRSGWIKISGFLVRDFDLTGSMKIFLVKKSRLLTESGPGRFSQKDRPPSNHLVYAGKLILLFRAVHFEKLSC